MKKTEQLIGFVAKLALLPVALAALPIHAGIIFSTDFSSATQAGGLGTAISMGGTATNSVTVSTLTGGTGVLVQIDSTSTAGQPVAPIFASASVGTNPSSNLTQAIANNEYFQFTISSTNKLNYGSFGFSMVKNGFGNFSGITLRSSADNYASDLVTVTDSAASGLYPASVDLSSIAAFDSLTNVTFRFYLYDEYSGNNNRHLGIDNIQIVGGWVSVPVPVYPTNGTTIYQTIPYLQWGDVVSTPYAGSYQIQIGQNSSFSVVLDDDTIPAMINHYVPAMEFAPQTLYWRVRYIDEAGTPGNWSSPWTLTIQAMPTVITVPLGSDWTAIQGYLSTALAAAPAELRFTPGTYNITRDTNDTDFLHIQSQGNILINGQGCTFVITDQGGTPCDFFYGRGATGPIQFKNFTVDYAPDSLAQFGGQVIDIEYLTYPDCAFTVKVDPTTYSAQDPLLNDMTTGIVLEPETLQRWHALDADPRLEVNETWSLAAANSTHGPDTYRFTPKSNKSAFYNHLAISNWFVTVERGGDLFYVYQSCPDLVINNVTSKACRGRAFIPRKACDRLRVVNNSILRTGNRALGMTSGGINDHPNLSPTNWFPWWEGNVLEYNADDMYNGNTDQCVFRNNTLRGPFRNAIWLHNNRQWVEGNTVIYAGTKGLSIDPGGLELAQCKVVNVGLIKNNTFIQPRITGLSMSSDLTAPLDESGDRYHTDIIIEGNIWHNHLQYEGLNISYAKRIIVRNNHVDSTGVSFSDVNDPLRAIGIYVAISEGVQILTNEVWDSRITPDKRIVVEPDVTNLTVVPGPDATPPEILHRRDGNVLKFSWPAKYWGWIAQFKHSLLSTQQWSDIAGSQTNLDIAIDPVESAMFYRLRQP